MRRKKETCRRRCCWRATGSSSSAPVCPSSGASSSPAPGTAAPFAPRRDGGGRAQSCTGRDAAAPPEPRCGSLFRDDEKKIGVYFGVDGAR